MYSYEAQFDEAGARAAERAFYIRPIRELRFLQTVAPPVGLAVMALLAQMAHHETIARVFAGIAITAVLFPLLMLLARPIAAAKQARQFPLRNVQIKPDSFSIVLRGREITVAWSRIKAVWDSGTYLTLVLNPFVGIHLPKQGMPMGAQDFIAQSIGATV